MRSQAVLKPGAAPPETFTRAFMASANMRNLNETVRVFKARGHFIDRILRAREQALSLPPEQQVPVHRRLAQLSADDIKRLSAAEIDGFREVFHVVPLHLLDCAVLPLNVDEPDAYVEMFAADALFFEQTGRLVAPPVARTARDQHRRSAAAAGGR